MNDPINEQPLDLTGSFAYRMLYEAKLAQNKSRDKVSLEREIRNALYRLLCQLRRGK
jgi:hypothetical protein